MVEQIFASAGSNLEPMTSRAAETNKFLDEEINKRPHLVTFSYTPNYREPSPAAKSCLLVGPAFFGSFIHTQTQARSDFIS